MSESFRIYVQDLTTGREIEVEAYPSTKLKEIFDIVINALGLRSDSEYSLALGAKEFGSQHYDKTLAELNIRPGDRLQLIARPRGGIYAPDEASS